MRSEKAVGRVLTPAPNLWRERSQGADRALRATLLHEIRSLWGETAAEEASPKIEGLSRAHLALGHRRVRYADHLDDLFDPVWRLAAQFHSRDRLIYHALAKPLHRWGLLITLQATPRDLSRAVKADVPWASDLSEEAGVTYELRRQGWALLTCATFEEANALVANTHAGRFRATLFSPEGKPLPHHR